MHKTSAFLTAKTRFLYFEIYKDVL